MSKLNSFIYGIEMTQEEVVKLLKGSRFNLKFIKTVEEEKETFGSGYTNKGSHTVWGSDNVQLRSFLVSALGTKKIWKIK